MSANRSNAKGIGSRAGGHNSNRNRLTIGEIVTRELKSGNTDVQRILAKVHKMRPEANTKAASVYWYANKAGVAIRKAA
jgi:hypothetical protein